MLWWQESYANKPAVWALGASLRSVVHSCCPDMRLPKWALVALPYSPDGAVQIDLDWTHVPIPVEVPMLLQLRAQLADVWRPLQPVIQSNDGCCLSAVA